ncbi:hypothetical protein CPB85DRAFT_1308622 [Mucidula mucida]|nr:hypothetical protein CPB85DRAFT_1308622 [Mucidula mucida]
MTSDCSCTCFPTPDLLYINRVSPVTLSDFLLSCFPYPSWLALVCHSHSLIFSHCLNIPGLAFIGTPSNLFQFIPLCGGNSRIFISSTNATTRNLSLCQVQRDRSFFLTRPALICRLQTS